MKKLCSFIMLSIGIAILFSSCSESAGISLTKRHYRNGYDIEVSGKRVKSKAQEIKTPENEKAEESEYASLQTTGEQYLKPVRSPLITNEASGIQSNAALNESAVIKNENAENTRINTHTVTKMSHIRSSIKTVIKHPSEIKNAFRRDRATVRQDDVSVHYYGGLWWTIISVLLVLWLLSLLTGGWGLGGLLYIFLVVALILILLRLIRIL